MSALPNSTFHGPWLSLGFFTDEDMATLELPPAALVGSADHSSSTTCTITSQGSVSRDATAINTPPSEQSGQTPSTSSTGLRRTAIDSTSHRESTQHEHRECFSEQSPDRYHDFSGSSEMASANMGRAGVVDLVPDLAQGHLNPQLAGASSTTAQSGHGFSGLLAGDLLQSLFSEENHSEAPSAQLGCFINDTNATCSPHLLCSEPEGEQYQHCVSQAPASSWEQIGGLVSYGQTRNHYADDFSSNRWYGNELNDPVYQFTPQLPRSCPFHILDESQSTTEPSLNTELIYNPMNEKGMIQKIPSNSPNTQHSVMTAFEDVQPQPESASQSLIVGELSGPTRTNVNSSQTPQRVRHNHVGVSGLLAQKQRLKHRRAFTDLSQRLETGETRKRGACLRCRMQRIRCYANPNDVHGPCSTCQGVSGPTLAQLPCLRYKISETALFDKGRHPQYIWSQRWKEMKIVEIKEWETSEVRTVELTQDIGNAVYKVNVRQFIPVEGDALERKWTTNGEARSYKCSSWAIVNMKETGQQLMKFVEDHIKTSIEYFIGDSDELLRNTYDMAFEHSEKAAASTSKRYLSKKLIQVNEQRAEERRLLRDALKLWVAIRMESRSERICSEENLGMVPQQFDPVAQNFNQVLVPPVMSAQIELIMTAMVLQPLKKVVLAQLQELIKANRARSWFTIYLCLFVLLHSCALLTSFENMQAIKYGLQSRYVYAPFIEELHHGSKIMLAYFHYCNKGGYPFATDWTIERNVKQAELNPDQLRFLTRTAQLVEQKSALFKHIAKRSEFEHDFFFVSRLYDKTWQPF